MLFRHNQPVGTCNCQNYDPHIKNRRGYKMRVKPNHSEKLSTTNYQDTRDMETQRNREP